jgi:hypothetical protein
MAEEVYQGFFTIDGLIHQWDNREDHVDGLEDLLEKQLRVTDHLMAVQRALTQKYDMDMARAKCVQEALRNDLKAEQQRWDETWELQSHGLQFLVKPSHHLTPSRPLLIDAFDSPAQLTNRLRPGDGIEILREPKTGLSYWEGPYKIISTQVGDRVHIECDDGTMSVSVKRIRLDVPFDGEALKYARSEQIPKRKKRRKKNSR